MVISCEQEIEVAKRGEQIYAETWFSCKYKNSPEGSASKQLRKSVLKRPCFYRADQVAVAKSPSLHSSAWVE
jgi:hypothetical protein